MTVFLDLSIFPKEVKYLPFPDNYNTSFNSPL